MNLLGCLAVHYVTGAHVQRSMKPEHANLVQVELPRIHKLLDMLSAKGISVADVTLIIVADLRSDAGAFIAKRILGKDGLHQVLERAEERGAVPSGSFPFAGSGGEEILAIIAPRFLEASACRQADQVPVLVIGHAGSMSFELLTLDLR